MSRRPRVVALGGGHGLAAVLRGLVGHDVDLTAVVTVADDGGSSGRIRRELPHLLPPGDLRMALSAVADPGWAALLQHRLAGVGELGGHPVGNLLLSGLQDAEGDPLAALRRVALAVGARATVLPLALVPLVVEADLDGGETVRGQVCVAGATRRVTAMRLHPPEPRVAPEVAEAIGAADLVVLGPGSLWTSVVVHLLVPQVHQALRGRRTVHVLNLVAQDGEAGGLGPADHLDVLHAHGVVPDHVLTDDRCFLAASPEQQQRLTAAGGLVRAPVADPEVAGRHDPAALAAALVALLGPPDPGTVGDRADSHPSPAPPARPGPLEDHPVQSPTRQERSWRH